MKQCPYCGAPITDETKFCPVCGQKVEQAPAAEPVAPAAPVAQPAAPVMNNTVVPGSTFVTNDEYTVATLSNSAVDNIFSGEGVTSEDAVCTNKRFYYKKKMGILNISRRVEIVDLKDITGTKITQENPLGMLILAVIATILSIVVAVALDEPPFMLPLGLFFLVLYAVLKKAHLRIEYAGGFIYFSVKKYGLKQILEFQKSIHLAKDGTNNK